MHVYARMQVPTSFKPFEVSKPHEPSIFDAATQPADSCCNDVGKGRHVNLSTYDFDCANECMMYNV